MDAARRREEIRKILGRSREPVSAATIASEVHVSRQIVVGDIALLRAGGADIQATPRGYILQTQDEKAADGLTYTIACRHSRENLAEELYAVVDNGGRLLDVIVEHPVYGQLTAPLQIASRYDVEQYLLRMENLGGQPLSMLTDGIHLHTLSCPGEEAFSQLLARLRELGMLVD